MIGAPRAAERRLLHLCHGCLWVRRDGASGSTAAAKSLEQRLRARAIAKSMRSSAAISPICSEVLGAGQAHSGTARGTAGSRSQHVARLRVRGGDRQRTARSSLKCREALDVLHSRRMRTARSITCCRRRDARQLRPSRTKIWKPSSVLEQLDLLRYGRLRGVQLLGAAVMFRPFWATAASTAIGAASGAISSKAFRSSRQFAR